MTITWSVGVDWDADDTFTEENGRVVKIGIRRGREYGWSNTGRTPIRYGEAIITLDNYDRRYDPNYASGALYGTILPGRRIRITATESGVTYPVFAGWVLDPRPSGVRARRQGILQCVDGLYFMSQKNCSAAGPTANYPVVSAIEDLATMSDWPFLGTTVYPFTFPLSLGALDLVDNGDTIDSWTTETNESILAALEELCAAFNGTAFATATGNLAYRPRYYSEPATFTLNQSELMKDIETALPWDIIYNSISITGTAGAAQTATNAASIAAYKTRNMTITGNDYIQSAAQALDYANHLALICSPKRDEARVRLVSQFAKQFGVDLLSSVSLVSDYLGINKAFTVGGIKHDWMSGGACTTELYLEESIYSYTSLQTYPFTFPLLLGWGN